MYPSSPSSSSSPRRLRHNDTPDRVLAGKKGAMQPAHSTNGRSNREEVVGLLPPPGAVGKLTAGGEQDATEVLVQQQKEQISELMHANGSLNSKVAFLEQEYSEKLDTATSRILELESVLAVAKEEADAKSRENSRLSSALSLEQARFKDLLADFTSKVSNDTSASLAQQVSYQSMLSALSSSRNKLEGTIFDLLRIHSGSSLIHQETEDLFNTINSLNNTITAIKAKSRAKIKKWMEKSNSNEERFLATKAELSETVWKLNTIRAQLAQGQESVRLADEREQQNEALLRECQEKLAESDQELERTREELEDCRAAGNRIRRLREDEVKDIKARLVASEERAKGLEAELLAAKQTLELSEMKWKESHVGNTHALKELEFKLVSAEASVVQCRADAQQQLQEIEARHRTLADENARSLARIQELEAALQEATLQSEEERSSAAGSLETVRSQHAASVQEIKAMQAKLYSTAQQIDELQLRVKDADLRCSMLVSDNNDLRRQKDEVEAAWQSRAKQLSEELEAATAATKQKVVSLKSMTFKVSELEKTITDLRAELATQHKNHEQQCQTLSDRCSSLSDGLSAANAELAACRSSLEAATASRERSEEMVGILKGKLVELDKEKLKALNELDDRTEERDELQKLCDRMAADTDSRVSEAEMRLKAQETAATETHRRLEEQLRSQRALISELEDAAREQTTNSAAEKERHQVQLRELHRQVSELQAANTQLASAEQALKASLEEESRRRVDVTARHAASVQEIKAMQAKLYSTAQQIDELQLRVKDADLRCNMLVSDNNDLRRQKDEVEAAWQSRAKQLSEELEAATAATKQKVVSLKSMTFKVSELEKTITDLRAELATQDSASSQFLQDLRDQLKAANEKVRGLQSQLVTTQQELDLAEEGRITVEQRCLALQTRLAKAEETLDQTARKLRAEEDSRSLLLSERGTEAKDLQARLAVADDRVQVLEAEVLATKQAWRLAEQSWEKTRAESLQARTVLEEKVASMSEELSAQQGHAAVLEEQRRLAENSAHRATQRIAELELQVEELGMAVKDATASYEDAATRHAASVQEIKAMQAKLYSTAQQIDELQLRVKDADLRCNMLVSDNNDLRRQKDEVEAQIARLTTECSHSSQQVASLSSQWQGREQEVHRLEGMVNQLTLKLEARENEYAQLHNQVLDEKDAWRRLASKLSWKCDYVCSQVEGVVAGQAVPGDKSATPWTSPTRSESRSPRKTPRMPRSLSISEADADLVIARLERLVETVDELEQAHRRAVAEEARSTSSARRAEEDLGKLQAAMSQSQATVAQYSRELETLRAERGRLAGEVETMKREVEAATRAAAVAQQQCLQLTEDLEHAQSIVLKQKQALESANEVMKRQRCELDDANGLLLAKARDADQSQATYKQQQGALDESRKVVDRLNAKLAALEAERMRLEQEVAEYQNTLVTMVARFQTEFGSLQTQLADLQSFSQS